MSTRKFCHIEWFAPIIPDPDDPGHYEWDSEPEPVKQTRWRRLLGWLGKLLLAALVSSIVSVALLRFIDPHVDLAPRAGAVSARQGGRGQARLGRSNAFRGELQLA